MFHDKTPAQPLGGPAHVREAVTAFLVIIGKSDPVVQHREATIPLGKLQADGRLVCFRMAEGVGERVVRYREKQALGFYRQRRARPPCELSRQAPR